MRHRSLCIGLLLFAIIGVVSTYARLNFTDDESFHISCGMEWLKKGIYHTEPLHPPLARIMNAVLLYDFELLVPADYWKQFSIRDAYIYKSILNRFATLPFYLFSCWVVFAWSRKLFGEIAALWSLALYVSLSSVTAHAGLATTDMIYMSMLFWAIYSGVNWLEQPEPARSIRLGTSTGLAFVSKFSTLAQLPAAMVLIVLLRWRSVRLAHVKTSCLYVIPCIVLIILLIYRFDYSPLIDGIEAARKLSSHGFGVWFYGALFNKGVWSFFPVVFFFKTPLSFFVALMAGIFAIRTSQPAIYPLLAALSILLASMTSHINLGVRHVLILYPLLAIPAGYGLYCLWQKNTFCRTLAVLLLTWQFISFIRAYPEHIAYFNELAGDHPEFITLDSDYDWGQEMIPLDEELQRRGITEIYICTRYDAYMSAKFVVRAEIKYCPAHPPVSTSGAWIAAGRAYMLLHDNIAWLWKYEAVQIGHSTMDLYYIPPVAK